VAPTLLQHGGRLPP